MKNDLPEQLGCPPDPIDENDHIYYGASPEIVKEMPSWEEGYSILDEVKEKFNIDFPERSQMEPNGKGTLACTCFGGTADLMLGHLSATGKLVSLSVRDPYSKIRLPNGGSYVRDFYKYAHQHGICEDRFMPTYKPDGTVTEEWLRNDSDRTPIAEKNAVLHRIDEYLSIPEPNFELIRQAIFENKSVGGGMKGINAIMGHFFDYTGWAIRYGYQAVERLDSVPLPLGGQLIFRRWIVKIGDQFFMNNASGSEVKLYSIWTARKDYPETMSKLTTDETKRLCDLVLHRPAGPEFMKYAGQSLNFVLGEIEKAPGKEWKRQHCIIRFFRAIGFIK